MQSPYAHDVPHYTIQALRALEKRAVVLPNAFGLRSIDAGWTWCASTRGGRGVRDARMIYQRASRTLSVHAVVLCASCIGVGPYFAVKGLNFFRYFAGKGAKFRENFAEISKFR